jgi:branched-chain amino acid transport system substrate-binding protein
MDTITIGLLLPLSTILPVNKDFEKGFKEALKQFGCDLEFELVKEFIGQGGVKLIKKAGDKLSVFDDVDLITGEKLRPLTQGPSACWFNPYLCI